ncbi:MAG: STAS domain-containing protein [bacterium]|nr:STAS domain-containing protein [bacterium]
MGIKEKIIDNVAVLVVGGKLMGGPETDDLREKVYSLVSDDMTRVVIDLSKLKWLNSSGLGALMACHTTLVNKGGTLKLAHATERVKSLLMITQLMKIFENYETVDRALASFKSS